VVCGDFSHGIRFDETKSCTVAFLWRTHIAVPFLGFAHFLFLFLVPSRGKYVINQSTSNNTHRSTVILRLHCWDYVSQQMSSADEMWQRDCWWVSGWVCVVLNVLIFCVLTKYDASKSSTSHDVYIHEFGISIVNYI